MLTGPYIDTGASAPALERHVSRATGELGLPQLAEDDDGNRHGDLDPARDVTSLESAGSLGGNEPVAHAAGGYRWGGGKDDSPPG